MMKRIRNLYLKHFKFDVWWKEYCEEHYCSRCKDRTETCSIDYITGKCIE